MPDDAIDMLKDDHKKVKGLLDQLARAQSAKKRQELLPQIQRLLVVHSRLEEELFYPAFDKGTRTKESHIQVLESREEHELAEQVLEELAAEDPDTPEFQAKARLLKELVVHHADEEEKEMLPKARKAMTERRLKALGEDMMARKEQLMQEVEQKTTA